jgi:uncharacterized membrane protein
VKPSPVVAHVAPLLLGVSAGLRSFTPLAVAAWFANKGELRVKRTWASWLAHPAAVAALTAAAAGEYVGDKLPNTPDRTAPLGLVGRLALGGTVGAIMATSFKRNVAGGVALGALGAAAGTYGGFYLRKGLTKGIGAADLPVAISGDAASIALAIRSLRRLTA